MRTALLPVLILLIGSIGCGADSGEHAVPTSPSPPGTTPPTTTTPTPAIPNFAGVWQGEYRVTACTGERHCSLSIGSARAFTLRLDQSGSTVAGVFTGDVGANVTGVVSASGELVLSGGANAVSRFDSNVDMQRITLRLSDAAELAGNLAYTVTYPPDNPYFEALTASGTPSARSGDIIRAARSTAGAGSDLTRFDGTWTGRFIVRDCSTVGWRFCYPTELAELRTVELELHQNGTAVDGILSTPPYRIPVHGSAQGSSLRLEGDLVTVASGGRMVIHLSEWTTMRDSVGRLQGRFTHDVAYEQDTGGILSTHYDNELVGVVLSP